MWFIDDGVLGILARARDPSWDWPAGVLAVLESVARGSGLDRSGRRPALLAWTAGDSRPVIDVKRIVVGTQAFAFLDALRTSWHDPVADLGEHESIAWCHTEDPDGVFVTMDKGALMLASAELGPSRVATPFDLWLDLMDSNLIDRPTCEWLANETAKPLRPMVRVPTRLVARVSR